MSPLKIPLFGKILLVFLVNVAVLGLLGFGFLQSQFKLSLDWMLAGEPGDRIAAMGDTITYELSRVPESEWHTRLQAHERKFGVIFALFDGQGQHRHGTSVSAPMEVAPKLIDRRPPGERAPRRLPGPVSKRPANAPPKPRFLLRAGNPARYWAGISLDLVAQDGKSMTLVMVSRSISGGGLFFDLRPWFGLGAAALLISALIWMPFVRGITGFIKSLNEAAANIAHGKFDERIAKRRSDELGELSTSVNTMAAQLGDYMAQQRRITADIAHELCSPIARMQMALGIIEQRSTADQASYLQKVDHELQHMAKLVEEVLAFSKAETIPDREAAEQIDLRALLADVVAREAPDAGIAIDLHGANDENIVLMSIRSALDRAIGNIVRNAVRYATNVEIRARCDHDRIVIEVLDQGPGVPPDSLPRLFEPFYRPEAARGRNTGGSGLGLAITRRCIEACGGTVTARLREPTGLVVEIDLPQSITPPVA